MTPLRKAVPCRLALLLALSLGTQPTHAQTTPGAAPSSPAPVPISQQARTRLHALFPKLRPGVLVLEDCPPADCGTPDGVATAFHIGNGDLLTAYSVIFGAKNLTVRTIANRRLPVNVVGYDERADLALLHVDLPTTTPVLPLATGSPAVGNPILSIGNGLGTFLTSKVGRITALNVVPGRPDFPSGTLALDAPLVPGDGGAPIINMQGEVIGLLSYLEKTDGRNGRVIAHAVPLTQGDARLADLRRGVKRDAPTLGVDLKLPTEFANEAYALPAGKFAEFSQRAKLDLGSTPGAFFTQVAPGSPAARAGLQPLQVDRSGKRTAGDIVTAVNGQRVTNFDDFNNAIYRYQPGDTITLTVLRGGKPLEVKLTLVGRSQVSP